MKTKILSVLMSLGIIAMTLPITVFAESSENLNFYNENAIEIELFV